MSFDWQRAIDKARSSWRANYVHDPTGGECAIGILASTSGMDMGDHKGLPVMTYEAVRWVSTHHPEVVQALYDVLWEQEPEHMASIRSDYNYEDLEKAKAEQLVDWNDTFCTGGERLATYLEKAAVR